ncbi:selenide, water dikinase SelD [Pontivivens insulae]|uniref:Selenide, water dikinase n=1 Tax=Pontivivens insulae TaxID=1639689 RepID=A0A2R8AD42_9RHOB|nr:selenide, water dikinase SelD [Pontivivens insulae]RED14082.1 selenide,water dikinase [Pontivivens insulae]SPF30156.1 Selenide, water dikinase [Pontivivens insulae]
MKSSAPVTRDIALIGGGHTHALVLRKWGMTPLPGARLTLITPEPTAPYTGMLPGHVAGHYPRELLDIDLMRLARFAGARIILAPMTGLDPAAGRVRVAGRPDIEFDVASINIGITSQLPGTPVEMEHAVPAKPLGPFADRWAAFCTDAGNGDGKSIVVIGGGVGGTELAMAMKHRLPAASVTVVEAASALSDTSARTGRAVRRALTQLGVTLREQCGQAKPLRDAVETCDDILPSDFTVTVAGACPPDALQRLGLPLADGFISVDRFLRSTGAQNIFSAGDCVHMTASPRVKAGVFAVRQAPILFDNLRAAAMGRSLRPYKPQKDYLKLISLGAREAVADWKGFAPSGSRLWTWKDKIDRDFMQQFSDLPPMTRTDDLPREAASGVRQMVQAQPLCGGCGAKVGAGTLRETLALLPAPTRPDVLRGAGDDAALLRADGRFQALSTDHFRAFIEDPYLLTRIAALHAMGDVWAMGGTPQAALSQLILPRMADAPQARLLSEITQAASQTFADAGADLVGGHSSLGAELTVGFTVTGLVEHPIGVDGAQAGDALILTKPIGTGTILAADMQYQAPGAVVKVALDSMAQSSGPAAVQLAPFAHAMTDITGFGLAGHLLSMLEGAGLRAKLSEVPLLDGAEALSAAGHRSSLFPQNSVRRDLVTGPVGPVRDLMFDPQTAGGLLAAVPGDQAEQILAKLGQHARIIGMVEEGSLGIDLPPS